MQPIYFGKSGRQLLGVYHPALVRRPGNAAVLLCYPAVQEYMRTHWAMRKLATLLAREGLHALRFDYHGTGDSAGGAAEGSVARWLEDVRAAAAELRDQAGARRVSLVGLRLGAALGALASAGGLELKDLVLWEPPADGRAHVSELEAIERISYENFNVRTVSEPEELLGYPFPAALRAEIEAIDLRAVSRCAADRILIYASEARPEHEAIRAALRDRAGRPPESHVVREEAADRQEGVLLSSRVLQQMAGALSGGGS